jgi:NADH-quinone oxidoreductase subunit F
MGGAAYAKIGKPNNTGTRSSASAATSRKPGYYEFEVGALTMGQLLNDVCGGIKGGRKLKAVIPGGSSAKVLKAGERYKIKTKKPDGTMEEKEIGLEDIPIDFDTLAAAARWPAAAASSSWTRPATWSSAWPTSTRSTRTNRAASARPAAKARSG